MILPSTARDETVDAAGERGRVVGHHAVEDLRLVEQQLRDVGHVGLAGAELGVGQRLHQRVARVDLQDRLGADVAGLARQQPVELAVRARRPRPPGTRRCRSGAARRARPTRARRAPP